MFRGLQHNRSLRRYLDELISVCMHDILTFENVYKRNSARWIAAKWGGGRISNTLGTMDWLLEEGYRTEFERYRRFLSAFSEADRKAYIDSLPEYDPSKRKMAVIERTWGRLPADGIAAFDYAWCAALAVIGSTLKRIGGRKILVEYGTKAAIGVQSAYSDWEEYLFAYTVGAEFSGRFPQGPFSKKNEAYYLRLLYSWQQPANKVDWKLNLHRLI